MHPQASRVGPLIAILEDHAPTCDLFCEILSEERYQTLCCATASSATADASVWLIGSTTMISLA